MKQKNVLKNIIMLYGMSIAKIVFPLLTLPYLTRVLSVESYGVVSYVKAVMQYMQLGVDFGFMLSGTRDIVKAKRPRKIGKRSGRRSPCPYLIGCGSVCCPAGNDCGNSTTSRQHWVYATGICDCIFIGIPVRLFL